MERRCVIITAWNAEHALGEITRGSYVICADGAYKTALEAGITPDLCIGDFDSAAAPSRTLCLHASVICLPREKDDTDTAYCVKEALRRGYTDILILGGVGGRLDHTIANLQTLALARKLGAKSVRITDGENSAFLLYGRVCIPRRENSYLSVFALDECRGVSETGVKYPLDGVTLTPDCPLGVSNEITGEHAVIKVDSGTLLIIESRK